MVWSSWSWYEVDVDAGRLIDACLDCKFTLVRALYERQTSVRSSITERGLNDTVPKFRAGRGSKLSGRGISCQETDSLGLSSFLPGHANTLTNELSRTSSIAFYQYSSILTYRRLTLLHATPLHIHFSQYGRLYVRCRKSKIIQILWQRA